MISAGLPVRHLRPHASHPDADRLFSANQTSFRQYGQQRNRQEKIEYLLSHQLALDNLRVCYESNTDENCGRCLKCILVMTILEIHDALSTSEAFPGDSLDLENLHKTYLSQGTISFRNTQELARARSRQDIVEAIDGAFRRTEQIDRWLKVGSVRSARARLGRQPTARWLTRGLRPLLWRLGRCLNRFLP